MISSTLKKIGTPQINIIIALKMKQCCFILKHSKHADKLANSADPE